MAIGHVLVKNAALQEWLCGALAVVEGSFGCVYAALRTNPHLHMKRGYSCSNKMGAEKRNAWKTNVDLVPNQQLLTTQS
jgi:hypothetical protein